MEDKYRYYPKQFHEPFVNVLNIRLICDFKEDSVTVTSETTFKTVKDKLDVLNLNAKNLEILRVSHSSSKASFTYENDILSIKLNRTQSAGSIFKIKTVSVCRPTTNLLEGLYYDITPKGLPKTIISQCQQWGFQRIAPCIDDMRAKCTWDVKIIANNKYGNLISNGDVVLPRTRYDNTRDTITYQNKEPMPPYLFFLGVGTWDTFSRDFVYPNGKKIRIELLAPVGADEKNANEALDITADAILWTHIYTGAERYENIKERDEVYSLCIERNEMIKNLDPAQKNPEYDEISNKIESLCKNIVFGYRYPYEVYREIAMHNSDFGGMENTGNTTILASRIMPNEEITDAAYEYMVGIKQHEFYHNLNGSGVTGDTPFSIWLNEAVTVMAENDYLAFRFGKDYIRLSEILQMRMPGSGTFSLDTGACAMPIEPEGFNDPNDLITSVTYVKAPEFTRMIEFMLGKPAFAWALDLYHRRFAGINASSKDFIRTMEDVGKTDFSFMADRWLHQTGYPNLKCSAVYNKSAGVGEITVTQSGFGDGNPWIFPLSCRLYTSEGYEVCEFSKKIDAESITFSVPCSREFAFAAWNTNHTAYVKIDNDVCDDELYLQLKYDEDVSSRFIAFCELFEREMIKLCEDETREPSQRLVDVYTDTLTNTKITQNCGVLPLTLFDSVEDERFKYSYTLLYNSKKRFMKAVAKKYEYKLRSMLYAYSGYLSKPEVKSAGLFDVSSVFKARAVKNLVLSLLASLDRADMNALIKRDYERSSCATDRINAVTLYLSSSARDRFELLRTEFERSKENALAFENFISAVASSSSPDTVKYLKEIESSPEFSAESAGPARAMYLRFAQNRKLSLETEEGRAFLEESLLKMAEVNEYLSTGILSVFSHINSYSPGVRDSLKVSLKKLVLNASNAPAIVKTAENILNSLEAE